MGELTIRVPDTNFKRHKVAWSYEEHVGRCALWAFRRNLGQFATLDCVRPTAPSGQVQMVGI